MVQLGDRASLTPKRRDLPDHEHAVAALLRLVHVQEPIAVPSQTLRRDAQASQVELLERLPDLLARLARGLELPPLAFEGQSVLRLGAAGRVARGGLEQDGPLATDRLVLERGNDRAGGHRLFREDVGRTHQHADARAARHERRSHRAHHRRGSGVVDASGEENAHALDVFLREQSFDRRLPQDEARSRPDVAAALATFEDEAPRAVFEEHVEQARRRNVQVGRDARLLERPRHRGAAPRDQRDGGLGLEHERQLLVANLRWHEAEDADAPGAARESLRALVEDATRLVAAHERQREERQAARLRHGVGERGPIAHARHRALRDGVPGAVLGCELRRGAQRIEGAGLAHVAGHLLAERADERSRGRQFLGERSREGGVLADGQGIRRPPAGECARACCRRRGSRFRPWREWRVESPVAPKTP